MQRRTALRGSLIRHSLQSVASALGKDMIGGQLSTVPFGSDAWELVSSRLFGDQYYGMDAVTVTAISDTIGSLNGMGELIGSTLKSVSAGEDVNWDSARIKLDGYMDDISKAAGVPYENVVNLFNAGYRHACIAALFMRKRAGEIPGPVLIRSGWYYRPPEREGPAICGRCPRRWPGAACPPRWRPAW